MMGQDVKGIIRSTGDILIQVLYHCSEGTAKTDVVKVAFLPSSGRVSTSPAEHWCGCVTRWIAVY